MPINIKTATTKQGNSHTCNKGLKELFCNIVLLIGILKCKTEFVALQSFHFVHYNDKKKKSIQTMLLRGKKVVTNTSRMNRLYNSQHYLYSHCNLYQDKLQKQVPQAIEILQEWTGSISHNIIYTKKRKTTQALQVGFTLKANGKILTV